MRGRGGGLVEGGSSNFHGGGILKMTFLKSR